MTWKERRIVAFLMAVLAILFAAVVVVLAIRYRENRDAEPSGTELDTPGDVTDPTAYTALRYECDGFTRSFSLNEDGKWVWTDDPSFPLDETTVLGITSQLVAWKPQQVVTDADALAGAGFDDPTATLVATTARGDATLLFGRTTTDGNSYYVRLNGDETKAYIIPDTLYQLISRPIYDMMVLPELPELTEDRLLSITIQGPRGEDGTTGLTTVLTAQNEGDVTTWRSSGANVTDDATVRALLDDILGMSITKCVDYAPSDEAAEICGFEALQAKVVIRYATEGGSDQTLELFVGNRLTDGSGRYVRWNEDTTIYSLPTESLDPLMRVAVSGLEG